MTDRLAALLAPALMVGAGRRHPVLVDAHPVGANVQARASCETCGWSSWTSTRDGATILARQHRSDVGATP